MFRRWHFEVTVGDTCSLQRVSVFTGQRHGRPAGRLGRQVERDTRRWSGAEYRLHAAGAHDAQQTTKQTNLRDIQRSMP